MRNHQLLSAVEVLRYRYLGFSKKKKGEVLAELEQRFSVDRKYLIRLLARRKGGRPKTPLKIGRPSKYGDAGFQTALRKVWKITYFMCGRYLKVAMPEWLPSIEDKYGSLPADVRDRLLKISAATIDRHLRPQKAVHGRCFTRPGSIIRSEIPVQGSIWDISEPGYIECDTVAHCGGSMLGDFINSVTTVDIATTWTEVRGTWGRGSSGVIEQLKSIEDSLPFTVLGYDADNGGEVLNWHIIKYFHERDVPAAVTRSRSYQKNDNAHVEQKNNTVPRRYLGYERLDCQEILPLVNHYYKDILCPLLNHFYPSNKLKDKQLIDSKRKRFYDKPMTPYARVMLSDLLPQKEKDRLKAIHDSINPVELRIQEQSVRKQIDVMMKQFRSKRQNTNLKIQGFGPLKSRILSDYP